MPSVKIDNLGSKTIDCPEKCEKLLHILLKEVDWMHACGGNGRCTTCRFDVISGMEGLSPETKVECTLRDMGKLGSNQRLACQVSVIKEVNIKVPAAYKMPNVTYTDSSCS